MPARAALLENTARWRGPEALHLNGPPKAGTNSLTRSISGQPLTPGELFSAGRAARPRTRLLPRKPLLRSPLPQTHRDSDRLAGATRSTCTNPPCAECTRTADVSIRTDSASTLVPLRISWSHHNALRVAYKYQKVESIAGQSIRAENLLSCRFQLIPAEKKLLEAFVQRTRNLTDGIPATTLRERLQFCRFISAGGHQPQRVPGNL
jgi:hypothetical protein